MESWRCAIAKPFSSSKRSLLAVVSIYLSALCLTEEDLHNY